MVTTAQAEAAGVTRITLHALTRAGALDRVRHGVYKLVGAPWSRNDDIRAVWLQSEPGPLPPDQRRAAVSRQTAALVYGFGVLVPPAIQVTIPAPRRTTMPGVRWSVGQLDEGEIEWVDDMRVTRPARIISDLLADGYGDLEHLGSVAVDAVYEHKLTPSELIDVCGPYAVRYGFPAGSGEALARAMWDSYTTDAMAAA
jgi:hypothetical protein